MSAPFLIRNMADCVSRSMMARCSMENMPPSGPGDQELVSQPCSTCRWAHAASPGNSPYTLPLSLSTPTKHLAMSICPLRRAAQTALLPSPSSCFRSTPCSHRY